MSTRCSSSFWQNEGFKYEFPELENALNDLIRELNDGKLDKRFPIEWENYRNSLLLTGDEGLNKIPTRIYTIVNVNTWEENEK